jgi:hypothetical protein
MSRDQIRGWLIIIGLSLLATVFFNQSQQIVGIVFGALGLLFIVLLWFFGYSWYRDNLGAISLMPDRQRNALYGGAGALTVAAAMWSLGKFGIIDIGGLTPLIALVAIIGGLVAFWAWQESKRYYL